MSFDSRIPQIKMAMGKELTEEAASALYDPVARAITGFKDYLAVNYLKFVVPRNEQARKLFEKLTAPHDKDKFLMKMLRTKLEKLSDVLVEHDQILRNVARLAEECLYPKEPIQDPPHTPWLPETDSAIARSTIRQLYRDWASEAAAERDVCFSPILAVFRNLIENPNACGHKALPLRAMVPGAGLCRLAVELAKMRDVTVTATEISCQHLLMAHYILSGQGRLDRISPWALQFSNHVEAAHQFRSYTIPETEALDENTGPSTLLWEIGDGGAQQPVVTYGQNLVIKADDFRAYRKEKYREKFDVVVTCFFLDTAPNVIEYMRVVRNCLEEGGSWLNVGPLLWNCFENGPGGRLEGDTADDEAGKSRQTAKKVTVEMQLFDGKIELAWDEVIELLKVEGFEIKQNSPNSGAGGYILDRESMLLPMYQMGFFHAVRRV